jgi:hypothetical protein
VQLFNLPEATHFCTLAAASNQGIEQSLPTFHAAHPALVTLSEGTPRFDIHRVNLLMSAERWLLYSVGHYRRAVEMLVPATAPWAHVTLYYASFFSANALLAMFGGWVGQVARKTLVVEVADGSPGHQELRVLRGSRAKSPSGTGGSHRIFWDFFYNSVPTLSAWVPPRLALALTPVNGDFAWQIAVRNEVNYDMFHAWGATVTFYKSFNRRQHQSLAGPLAQQLDTTEHLARLALHFAKELKLSSAALADCGFVGDRAAVHRRLVRQAVPSLLNQSAFTEFAA